jgi:hypothetical protein
MADGMAVQSRRKRVGGIGQNSALYRASAGAGMMPICDRGETTGLTGG